MLMFGVSVFLQLMSSTLSRVIVMYSGQFHKQMVNTKVALKLFVLSLCPNFIILCTFYCPWNFCWGVNNNFKELSTNFGQFFKIIINRSSLLLSNIYNTSWKVCTYGIYSREGGNGNRMSGRSERVKFLKHMVILLTVWIGSQKKVQFVMVCPAVE